MINRIKRSVKRRLKNLIGKDKKKEAKQKTSGKKTSKKELSVSDKYYIELVVNETGWSFSQAHEAMKAVKRNYKVNFADYAKNALYKVPEDELEETCRIVKEKKKWLLTSHFFINFLQKKQIDLIQLLFFLQFYCFLFPTLLHLNYSQTLLCK